MEGTLKTFFKTVISGTAIAAAGIAFAGYGSVLAISTPAHAQTCTSEVAKDDLSDEQIVALYDCIKDSLHAGYAKEGGKWTSEFPSWGATATQHVSPGTHGGRFLFTTVNEIGFDEYIKFLDERGPMPVGSVLAKESFNVSKKNAVRKGPLFLYGKSCSWHSG